MTRPSHLLCIALSAGSIGAPVTRAVPLPEQRIDASVVETADRFGHGAAISGARLAVSSKYGDKGAGGLQDSGLVFVFARSESGQWAEEDVLSASDGRTDDVFGSGVGIDGDIAVVGAYFDDITPDGLDNAGAAYAFVRQPDGSWTEEQKLTPPVRAPSELFGYAVALDGSWALIGAPSGSVPPLVLGEVHVFERTGPGVWAHRQVLSATDATPGDQFGAALALRADRVIVGAPGRDAFRGGAYIFRRQPNGTWTEVEALEPVLNVAGERFGASVDIDGAAAIVGAPQGSVPGATGGAHVYAEGPADSWSFEQTLSGDAAAPGDQQGADVAIEGGLALVSALEHIVFPPGAGDTGVVYAFTRTGPGDWEQAAAVRPSDGAPNDQFGSCLALSDGRFVAGSPTNGGAASLGGGAYTVDVHRLTCPADQNRDGVINTADLGILLNAFGMASEADINGDGVVNTADLGLLLNGFGASCP